MRTIAGLLGRAITLKGQTDRGSEGGDGLRHGNVICGHPHPSQVAGCELPSYPNYYYYLPSNQSLIVPNPVPFCNVIVASIVAVNRGG